MKDEDAKRAVEPGREYYYNALTQSAEDGVRAIRDAGGTATSREADLAEAMNIPELFDRAERTFGRVEFLVNNAAFDQFDAFLPKTELANPLRRIGRPEDIAQAVVLFASRQADWITGQVLHVGGGNRM